MAQFYHLRVEKSDEFLLGLVWKPNFGSGRPNTCKLGKVLKTLRRRPLRLVIGRLDDEDDIRIQRTKNVAQCPSLIASCNIVAA